MTTRTTTPWRRTRRRLWRQRRPHSVSACVSPGVCLAPRYSPAAFLRLPARPRVGRPPKIAGRGKGRPKKRFGVRSRKNKMMGTARLARRAAARVAERKTKKTLSESLPPSAAYPIDASKLRAAIAVIIQRAYRIQYKMDRAEVVKEVADMLSCDVRTVDDVIEKLANEESPEKNRKGGGRPLRIKPGTAQADRVLGGLLNGFGARGTARLVTAASPDDRPVVKSVVLRTAKGAFGLVVNKRKVCKTGSRDVNSPWSQSRLAICEQFDDEINRRKMFVEGTLFLDEHSEFCVLGKKGHNGGSERWEWRAHRDEGTFRMSVVS